MAGPGGYFEQQEHSWERDGKAEVKEMLPSQGFEVEDRITQYVKVTAFDQKSCYCIRKGPWGRC